MDEKAYSFWLSNILDLGSVNIIRLLKRFGSPRGIYEASPIALHEVFRVDNKKDNIIVQSRKIWNLEREWENFLDKRIGFVTIEDENYPNRLKQIYNPPFSLFYIGELPDNLKPSAAIVGARECSEYGGMCALKLGEKLAMAGVDVISGLARGIDSKGHRGALRGGGKTYGILGCGVNVVYPPENFELYEEVSRNGGIISEYPPDAEPAKKTFPLRNRIVAGLSDSVFIMEAKEKSGSLITADLALDMGKDVFALPGRITDNLSKGTNRLINQGAGIITSIDNMVSELRNSPESDKNLFALEKDEMLVYSTIDLLPKSVQRISDASGIPFPRITEILFDLEEKGYIREEYNNHYIIL